MCPPYYKETEKLEDNEGNKIEINQVVYDRTDGTGVDYVEQIKINGVEVGHHTEHPDGTIHNYGVYDEDEDDKDGDDEKKQEDEEEEECEK